MRENRPSKSGERNFKFQNSNLAGNTETNWYTVGRDTKGKRTYSLEQNHHQEYRTYAEVTRNGVHSNNYEKFEGHRTKEASAPAREHISIFILNLPEF